MATKKSGVVKRLREAGITNRLMGRVTMKMQLDELEGYVETVERAFKEQLEREETNPRKRLLGLQKTKWMLFTTSTRISITR